jgi:hypothetical protein
MGTTKFKVIVVTSIFEIELYLEEFAKIYLFLCRPTTLPLDY